MRMWKINVKKLCNQHLLGEHVEMHMFAGTLRKGGSIKGYVETGLVEVHNIKGRHDEIAKEMKKRGMNHQSPLKIPKLKPAGKVDKQRSKKDLIKRCKNCRKNLK